MLFILRLLAPLAFIGYAVWWVFSMGGVIYQFSACPICKTRQAWAKTGRTREMSREPVYQREHLWTMKQTEWRCRECHYTKWHPRTSKNDDNLVD